MLLLQTRNPVTDSFRSKYVVIPIVDISLLNSLIRILHHDQQLMTHMKFFTFHYKNYLRTDISFEGKNRQMKQLRLPKSTDLSLKINAYVRRMVLFYHLWCRTASQGILPQWTQGSSNHSDTNSRTAAYRNRKFWLTNQKIYFY